MFNKILIANRGEIAVRIIRACHELGIKAVAVYSEADKTAMHVRESDEAYLIGPAPATESYLRQDTLVEVARKSGCCAIHPGYGFLAENAGFAQKVLDANLVFIGSSPVSIRLLGDKVESRKTMAKAGIPMTPGTKALGEDLEGVDFRKIQSEAEKIGFPVLVKAAGGGGGKGMRIVNNPEDLRSAIEGARREAQSAFGNPMVYIEKFITRPRHVEFQIFGDQHGNIVHLFERECSVQRRHQKIIEESPSPALNDDLRHRMGETAIAVAAVAGYYNAGTVEFLLDENNNYYFLEVNTRIQVEHPVTEMVVGVDLVVEQIRVAMGEELSWQQSGLYQRGHAIEARIYAEDAGHGFLPSAGPALYVDEPRGPGVRFDGGVQTGDEVSVYYDPIVGKLICLAEDRRAAITRTLQALNRTVIFGFTTNIEFLKAILSHPQFQTGEISTNFIPENLPEWKPALVDIELFKHALLTGSLANNNKTVSVAGTAVEGIPEPWQMAGRWEICAGGNK